MARSTRANGKRRRRKAKSQEPLYRPLDQDRQEIRVLRIRPTFGKRWNLEGSFEISSLLENEDCRPGYEAISWCWGEPGLRKEIVIDGKVTTIPRAADHALYWLCIHHGHVRVWIDAVCINQRNVRERSQQVSIMGELYSKAKQVLIWLGNETWATHDAFESIDRLHKQCLETLKTDEDMEKAFWDQYGQLVRKYLPLAACNWSALREFWDNPWFTRFWVVQEVVLANRATCYQGRFRCSWRKVSLAAQWAVYSVFGTHVDGSFPGLYNAASMWRESNHPARHSRDLTVLLVLSTDYQTTLPVDKVYAGLGLLDGVQEGSFSAGLYPKLTVDYSRSRDEVYYLATASAIQKRHSAANALQVVSLTSRLSPPGEELETDDLISSWIPRLDWIYEGERVLYPWLQVFGQGAAEGLAYDTVQNGGQWSTRVDAAGKYILKVPGVLVDRIALVGSVFDFDLLNAPRRLAIEVLQCRQWAMATVDEHWQWAPEDSTDHALAITLTCGTDGHGQAVGTEHVASYNAFLTACAEAAGQKHNGQNVLGKSSVLSDMTDPETGKIFAFHQTIVNRSHNRRFFVTASGRISMGPKNMQKDDQVCIMLGSLYPFVLRKNDSNGHWRLLGDTYVHGIMDGEYIRKLQSEGRLYEELQSFEIV